MSHFERIIGPYERCTNPLASYSDDTCIMREQAVEAVVFGAGGVRYRGLADSEGLGSAATAVEVCNQTRDGLGLTGLVGVAEARPAAEARS